MKKLNIDSGNNRTSRFPISRLDNCLLFFSGLFSLILLAWILKYCRYGFDITDEGYCLNWSAAPFLYPNSATQFGFVYHPLYRLLEGDITALRMSGILINFSLAWSLSWLALKRHLAHQPLSLFARLTLSSAFTTSVLTSTVFAGLWFATPSYNSLTLTGFLITSIGVHIHTNDKRAALAAGLCIGLGGWLAFMAKGSAAFGLGVSVLLYMGIAKNDNNRTLIISIVTAALLVLLSALCIDGSISVFVDRIANAIEDSLLLQNKSLSQMGSMDLSELKPMTYVLILISATVAYTLAYLTYQEQRQQYMVGMLLTFILATAACVIFLTHKGILFNGGLFRGLFIYAPAIAAIMLALRLGGRTGLVSIKRQQWALVPYLFSLPFDFALGTSTNYWYLIAGVGIFGILASLVLLTPLQTRQHFPRLLMILGLTTQFSTASIVHDGMETPYRQLQPLYKQQFKLSLGEPATTLRVSDEIGSLIKNVIINAEKSGFQKGTPIIDLTAESPGILYALGAKAIGQAWFLGGYPGSEKFATNALKRTDCHDLATAWLLLEPEGKRKLPPEILASFGGKLEVEYKLATNASTTSGVTNSQSHRVLQLWQPIRTPADAINTCQSVKTNGHP